ncbi:TauD/TfdA family dioxygenase [Mycolicibacillus parakoreensis]|uniref:TauD/TfdA family dioxygenase n=1 Tax=Mycolicibacillus parakoreensis TaxID=1069221 RepID=A0ABY3TW38_9MYCO|nr:TauD/TfdA family dioxygenase [Mycolicibacillus parakoreensis]MCV7317100.1 TauD/TfdA family dioxygenase [Mycolicibacillus parakoreensis]ULN51422.1 TauD/TfdA family dioxygenase [Mycolicibacillus parakoreensis]
MTISTSALTELTGLAVSGATAEDLMRPAAAAECLHDLDEHGVLVYRQIGLSDDELVAFSRTLGTVVVQPTGEHRLPEIQTITMDPTKTNPVMASYRRGNFYWHIDGATLEVPQKATVLIARTVDPAGGDTEFANTYAAYAALSDARKAEIADLRVRHSFAHAQSLGNPDAGPEERRAWQRVPDRTHPLVWTRRNGRRSLLLGATAAEVVGWPAQRGRALLDELLEWSTQPRFTLRHKWSVGDLVIWDNTGMLHRALPFAATSVRRIHRTTIAGEESVSAA